MKVVFFDTHKFEIEVVKKQNSTSQFDLQFLEPRLNLSTVSLAAGAQAICCFVNDHIDEAVCKKLSEMGVGLIALRCAGYNNVDLAAAAKYNIKVTRVPEYSPHAVAEHAVGLALCLNRKLHRAYYRIHELNFSLDGLVGFDFHKKTVGVIGTGKIGKVFAQIMSGFGCEVLLLDKFPDLAFAQKIGARYVDLQNLLKSSDLISLHCPLNKETHHLISEKNINQMKDGVMIINTGRGALIDTKALIEGLKNRKIGSAGLDVYEEEEQVFFKDLSESVLSDDLLARLLTFPNVMITSHQAFLTKEALHNIAETTFNNLQAFNAKTKLPNEVETR